MEYLSIAQIEEKWGITRRRIQRLCFDRQIFGAVKTGFYWAVLADAEKPKDEGIKSSRYIKSSN